MEKIVSCEVNKHGIPCLFTGRKDLNGSEMFWSRDRRHGETTDDWSSLSPVMGSLIESYEQQYSSLTADITFNIGRISNTHGGNVKCYFEFPLMLKTHIEFKTCSLYVHI